MDSFRAKHESTLPTARKIRRACNTELYRTVKRLKRWIPPERIAEAQQLYFNRVMPSLPYITEHRSNRKRLCDWWDEHVCPDIAERWEVEREELSRAFREAFGG